MHTHPCQHRNYGTDERTGRPWTPSPPPSVRGASRGPPVSHTCPPNDMPAPPAPPKNQSGRRAVRDERVGAAISDRTFVLDQAEQCFEMRARKGVGWMGGGFKGKNSTLSNLNTLERGSRSWKAPIFLVFAGVEEGFSICVVIILWLFNHSNKHKYHSKLHNSQHLHSNHRHYRHWRSAGWTRPHGNN
ncbi:hypothetical protein BHM03_00022564 [Ensete ventricosum]|nr:hypothetical protein BHM03_00022564 [Ensete ventricosum]